MKRTTTVLALLSLAVFAFATGGVMKGFATKYNIKPDSNLGKAKCMVCHTDTKGKLNPYGKDRAAAMKAAGSKTVNATILGSIEKLDSDKDGTKNGDEIRADKNPGKA